MSAAHAELQPSAKADTAHYEHATHSRRSSHVGPSLKALTSANNKLANPLQGIPREQLIADVDRFAEDFGLKHLTTELRKGALVAQDCQGSPRSGPRSGSGSGSGSGLRSGPRPRLRSDLRPSPRSLRRSPRRSLRPRSPAPATPPELRFRIPRGL
ncbi:hypothetical protein B0H15DRAFT_958330 [Mycena belliarum]|uniref:Uncharacterized protein n=1 Tax=Mycena belliarum TaxID=1033014 RepID=A0AAD6TNF5_9AGAR|nr:hypothetical protein B0H15DRAFT_958330 [Mycena belliae]